jgi:hypothetical protein
VPTSGRDRSDWPVCYSTNDQGLPTDKSSGPAVLLGLNVAIADRDVFFLITFILNQPTDNCHWPDNERIFVSQKLGEYMKNGILAIGLISCSLHTFAQTPFPDGVTGIGSKEAHADLLGKAFATKNIDGKGKAVGDSLEFKADGKVLFIEGGYTGNFVFDKDAWHDVLSWQGNEGRYCSDQHKWCMDLRTQGLNLLTRWGSEDGKNKPILVWSAHGV